MSSKSSSRLQLTHRALRDIQEIYRYSKDEWGKRTAEKYLDDLESGLERLRGNVELLRPEPDLYDAMKFYRVNKHLFVCDVEDDSVVVLTVIHASMDIPSRLSELEPTLAAEVELLHGKVRRGRRKRP